MDYMFYCHVDTHPCVNFVVSIWKMKCIQNAQLVENQLKITKKYSFRSLKQILQKTATNHNSKWYSLKKYSINSKLEKKTSYVYLNHFIWYHLQNNPFRNFKIPPWSQMVHECSERLVCGPNSSPGLRNSVCHGPWTQQQTASTNKSLHKSLMSIIITVRAVASY